MRSYPITVQGAMQFIRAVVPALPCYQQQATCDKLHLAAFIVLTGQLRMPVFFLQPACCALHL